MSKIALLSLLLAACSGAPVEDLGDGAVPDAGASDSDAGRADTGVAPRDAGGSDSAVVPVEDGGTGSDAALADAGSDAGLDAGSDAGAVDPCPGAVFDGPGGRCVYRMRHVSGALCPASFEPLSWGTVEDQRRLQALLSSLGAAGTGLVRNSSGTWWFQASGSSPSGLSWAPGAPSGMEQFSYLGADGLHSYYRAYGWQYCTRPAS